jgi:hypothetical protein
VVAGAHKLTIGLHCIENPIYVFPEMKLRGLVPNSYNHVSVSDLYIYSQDLSAYLAAAK